MSKMPDIGALALVPRTETTMPTSEALTFETLPVEVRLKIYEYLFVTIDFKQVTWLEDPDDAPWEKVIRRKVRPVNVLAIKAVTKKIELEVVRVLAACPIHLEVYGYHSLRGWQPEDLKLPKWVRHQIEKVAMNMSLWDLRYILPFTDSARYSSVRLIKLERTSSYGPIHIDLIRPHLAMGNRTFTLDRDTTNDMLEDLELEPALFNCIRSGRLIVQARYKFCERRYHAAGHPCDAMIAKGVLELSWEGMNVLELEAAEDIPRLQDGEKGMLKLLWESNEAQF